MMKILNVEFLQIFKMHFTLRVTTFYLKKLDHYGIRGISNDWLRYYLSDRTQFASMNSFNSDYKTMKFTVQ